MLRTHCAVIHVTQKQQVISPQELHAIKGPIRLKLKPQH